MIETRRLKNVIFLQIIDMTNVIIYQMLLHYCATYLFSMMWCRSGVFIVNFEYIWHHALVYILLTWSR